MPLAPAEMLTLEFIRDQLRQDALPVAVGLVLVAVGLSSMVLSAYRWKAADRAPLWFGLFSLIYGGRLLLEGASVRLLLSWDDTLITTIFVIVSYVVPIPAVLAAIEIVGPAGNGHWCGCSGCRSSSPWWPWQSIQSDKPAPAWSSSSSCWPC